MIKLGKNRQVRHHQHFYAESCHAAGARLAGHTIAKRTAAASADTGGNGRAILVMDPRSPTVHIDQKWAIGISQTANGAKQRVRFRVERGRVIRINIIYCASSETRCIEISLQADDEMRRKLIVASYLTTTDCPPHALGHRCDAIIGIDDIAPRGVLVRFRSPPKPTLPPT